MSEEAGDEVRALSETVERAHAPASWNERGLYEEDGKRRAKGIEN